MASRSKAPDINIEAEYCPEAVIEWHQLTRQKEYRQKNAANRDLSLKAKQHLVYLGWKLWYIDKKCRWEMRYTSPTTGKNYITLKNACESCIKDGSCSVQIQNPSTSVQAPTTMVSSKTRKLSRCSDESDQSSSSSSDSSSDDSEASDTITSTSKESEKFANQGESEVTSSLHNGRIEKKSEVCDKRRKTLKMDTMENVSEGCRKRGKVLSMSERRRCTLLYWLIDNHVLASGTNVICRGGNDIVKKGKISCDGIICDCCDNSFTMTAFEAHACCTRHRPSTSIFLEDGRSLLECQREALSSRGEKGSHFVGEEKLERYNDFVCLVCGLGGDIVLCDQCPSSFHLGCLGLDRVPDGDWFCPTCCCKICHQPKCKQEECADEKDNNVIVCVQCEQKFHHGCLKAIGFGDMEKNGEKKNWFCSVDCGKIFSCLKDMLGKPIKVANDLTWTLVKNVSNGDDDDGDLTSDEVSRNESKLKAILGVLLESFDPIVDVITRRELVEDLVFSRYSKHNRCNFSGFYNVVLEKMGEVISVATVRIYGPNVAEIVFVATKKQHRKQGMCWLLMDELERRLSCLKIRSLVLHSSKSTINTWTKSFGYAMMSGNEKCQFIGHTLLEFQNTVMCLKSLNRRM